MRRATIRYTDPEMKVTSRTVQGDLIDIETHDYYTLLTAFSKSTASGRRELLDQWQVQTSLVIDIHQERLETGQ
jgi:hypothetical protein